LVNHAALASLFSPTPTLPTVLLLLQLSKASLQLPPTARNPPWPDPRCCPLGTRHVAVSIRPPPDPRRSSK